MEYTAVRDNIVLTNAARMIMTVENWLTYLGVILLFMSTPGPSHLLMISVGMKNGFSRSLATAAGDLSANVIQMLLASFGLAALLISSQYGFLLIKWAGVTYLAWMGVRQIQMSFRPSSRTDTASRTTLRKLWLTGFITSAANPKAVIFFAALFPQFIDPASHLGPQLFILGATYLIVDGLFLSFYGKTSSVLAQKLNGPKKILLDRISGAGLISCSVLLAMKSQH
jgi:threonine/homoserine/homoserine lactone efflux protein